MKPQLAGRVSGSVRSPNWSKLGCKMDIYSTVASPEKNIDFKRSNWSASDEGRQPAWEKYDIADLRVPPSVSYKQDQPSTKKRYSLSICPNSTSF